MMADVARELLAAKCDTATLRRQMAEDAVFDDARWQALSELGLQGILVPEEAGGLGLGGADLVQVAQACGAVCLPEPLVDLAGVVAPLLAECGASDALARVLEDGALIVLAHPLTPFVAFADKAKAAILCDDDGLRLVQRADLTLTAEPGIDPLRNLFSVSAEPGAGERIAGPDTAPALLARAAGRGALFAAAQMLGSAQACVDLGVAYAQERKQFGRPIGVNQAIKHHLATAQVKIEFARPVVHAAAVLEPDAGPQSRARISHARLAAAEAADLAARTAMQVHGAMGYSWEVDVHFHLKRTLALSSLWGTAEHHRKIIAARVFDGPLGPDQTFPQERHHHG